ncbi:hypothetical protein [Scopulibacillus cellulosilyticus]|uniref:Uncharacterized protein n=1 Tax=Scopulibacillus cellulosilyticus TaxID=2665665 RepID=A0ABW2PXH6_9BACL
MKSRPKIIKKIERIFDIQISCNPNQKTLFRAYDILLKSKVILSLECFLDNDLKEPIYLLWYLKENAVDSVEILFDKKRLKQVKFIKQIFSPNGNTI